MKKSEGAAASDGLMMMRADPTAFDLRGLGRQVFAFTTEKDVQALAKDQTVVYFFAATWCPTCQALYQDLKTRTAGVPPGLNLVFVNYDKAAALKKKYGVTSQHTFVVVGPAGEKKKVWNGSTTLAEVARMAAKP